MLEYLMYIFSEQICMFGYLKTPDIMLSIVSLKKLDWTHTFDTHCNWQIKYTLKYVLIFKYCFKQFLYNKHRSHRCKLLRLFSI